MSDAPKKRGFGGLLTQIGLIFVVMMLLMVMVTAPAGAFVYFKTNETPGIDTTRILRPGNAKCWPGEAAPYVALFNAAANRYSVNVNLLVAIANRESGFNPKALSPTGYHFGLMQVSGDKITVPGHPDTPDKPYLDPNKTSRRYDPATNINAGASYIATILKNNKANALSPTDGQVRLAVSMYNAGPGAPQKADTTYVGLVLKDYQSYVRCAIQAGDTKSGAAITGAGAHQLANWVDQNPGPAKQKGEKDCSPTLTAALNAAFHTSTGKEGLPLRVIPASELGQAAADSDVQEAQQILAAGDIPIWHIVGDASGQHWVAILGISGSAVTFYDPASGTVSHDYTLTSTSRAGGYYFGATAGQPQGLERGYRFSPPKAVAQP